MEKKQNIFYIVIVLLILFLILMVVLNNKDSDTNSGQYDEFATCIKDSGAVFYGTSWCPFCNDNKKMFGKAQRFLPYVECSDPKTGDQLEICKENNIEAYPTWVFPNGEKITGLASFEVLSENTNCPLPE